MLTEERHLAAILFTDVVGYTAMMQKNEAHAVNVIRRYNEVLSISVNAHRGNILNNYGDGSLCSFTSAFEALSCAIEIQNRLKGEPEVPLRIGLHIGEIFFENGKVLGDGVNIASRIQSLGVANSILFSAEIYSKVKNQPEFRTTLLGHFRFKNVEDEMEVFALTNEGLSVPDKARIVEPPEPTRRKNRLWVVTSVLLLLGLAGAFIYKYWDKPDKVVNRSIAVLPFSNLSNNKELEYFGDGIAEDILDRLTRVPDLKVKSRTSTLQYRDAKMDITDIGKALGVSTIVEGSIRNYGDSYRIAVQLIDVETGNHLFSNKYDINGKDVLNIFTEVADAAAIALSSTIAGTEPARKLSLNPESYKLYLKGRFFWNLRKGTYLFKAVKFFHQAIEEDPEYAAAYSGLADCYTALGYISALSPEDAFGKARTAALKALSLDANLADAHASLGYIKFYYDWDWNGAEREFKKAIELNPKYAIAYEWYGWFLTSRQRFEEAEKVIRIAENIDSLSATINTDMGFSLYYGGKLERSLKQLNASLALSDSLPLTHLIIGRVYQDMGRYNESIEEYKKTLVHAKDWVVAVAALGNVYGVAGKRVESVEMLTKLFSIQKQGRYVTPYGVALVYLGMGDKDNAFEWLNKCYKDRSHWLVWLKLDPRLNSLRSDPRFIELSKKIGL